MSTVATNIRIDKELKAEATDLFNDLGLGKRGQPHARLLAAIEEAEKLEKDPNTKRYTDMEEMWADLEK